MINRQNKNKTAKVCGPPRTAGKIPFREDASSAMFHDRRVVKRSNGQTISLQLNSATYNQQHVQFIQRSDC